MDREEMTERARKGLPLYGTSNEPEWVQGAAYRNSAFSQLKFSEYRISMSVYFPALNVTRRRRVPNVRNHYHYTPYIRIDHFTGSTLSIILTMAQTRQNMARRRSHRIIYGFHNQYLSSTPCNSSVASIVPDYVVFRSPFRSRLHPWPTHSFLRFSPVLQL